MLNLKELRDEDVRGLADSGVSDDHTASEGRRIISWIWMLEGASDGSEDERASSSLWTMAIFLTKDLFIPSNRMV